MKLNLIYFVLIIIYPNSKLDIDELFSELIEIITEHDINTIYILEVLFYFIKQQQFYYIV